MSKNDQETRQDSRVIASSQFFSCPCFGTIDGDAVCLNGNDIELVNAINLDTDILERMVLHSSDETLGELPLCAMAVTIDEARGCVICASRGIVITLQNKELTPTELLMASEMFPDSIFTSKMDICNECLYKGIMTMRNQVEEFVMH